MKTLIALTLAAGILILPAPGDPKNKGKDPIEQGLREAFSLYQKEDLKSVTQKLRAILKLLDEKNAAKIGEALPDRVEEWMAAPLVREDLSSLGGGVSVKRTYTLNNKSITAKLVKDSPLITKWLEVLANREALKFTGKKVHTIDGEAALVDSERKILVSIEGELLLELEGDNDCDSKDILAFARKLDLKKMKRLE